MKIEKNKKYNCMENTIHEINREQIKLNRKEEYNRNRIMHYVIKTIQKKAEELDNMIIESHIFFGGSYFCGTKIKLPDEYDIDILMKLPMKAQLSAPKRGFLSVQLPNFHKNDCDQKYGTLASFLDESNYVIPEKVQNWFQSIVHKCLNTLPKDNNNAFKMKSPHGLLVVTVSVSGPAITIHIKKKTLKIDVDLIPSFTFPISEWKNLYPVQSRGKMNYSDEFFVVPKSPKEKVSNGHRLWKPSFQKEENTLIKNLYNLKPSIKLLKLLKEELNHKLIKSYYMKTVVMHMLVSGEYPEVFWKTNSLSFVFMSVLKYYSNCLKNGKIFCLWTNENLLDFMNKDEVFNISQRIEHMVQDLEKCIATDKSKVGYILKRHFGLKIHE